MNNTQNSLPNNENPELQVDNKPLTEGAGSVDSETIKPSKVKFGLNEGATRVGVYAITFIVMVLIVWGIGSLIVNAAAASPDTSETPNPTQTALPDEVATPVFSTEGKAGGVVRFPKINEANSAPVESRYEIEEYTVEPGDTIFGIAEKFGLAPETVLWSNRYIVGDNPVGLSVGIELLILPEDGLIHRWEDGEGLNGVASYYGVSPDTIINYPGNDLDPNIVGDYANPNIEPGTMLVVPNGTRPAVSWIVPRDNPASGNAYLGPGACGGIIYGDVGTGSFTWPTTATWLSGYDFTPPVHNGLDFDGILRGRIWSALG